MRHCRSVSQSVGQSVSQSLSQSISSIDVRCHFIDVEEASRGDFDRLESLPEAVRQTEVLLLLQTKELLQRPYCLVEVLTAIVEKVPIVPVRVRFENDAKDAEALVPEHEELKLELASLRTLLFSNTTQLNQKESKSNLRVVDTKWLRRIKDRKNIIFRIAVDNFLKRNCSDRNQLS